MKAILSRVGTTLAITAMTGCATTTPVTVGGYKHEAGLHFVAPGMSSSMISSGRPKLIASLFAAQEQTVVDECDGNAATGNVTSVASLLSNAVGGLIDLGVDAIDKKLQAALKAYTATYSATEKIDLYKDASPSMQYNCFRVTRGIGGDSAETDDVHLDLVAEIRMNPNRDRLQIRPLRLYFAKPGFDATSSNGDYGLAVSLQASSIWRTNNEGKEGITLNKVFLKEHVEITGEHPLVKYYDLAARELWTDAPMLPVSQPLAVVANEPTPYGEATFTTTVVETGVPSELLKEFAGLFSGSKSDLEKLLSSSVDAKLRLPAASSNTSSAGTAKPAS